MSRSTCPRCVKHCLPLTSSFTCSQGKTTSGLWTPQTLMLRILFGTLPPINMEPDREVLEDHLSFGDPSSDSLLIGGCEPHANCPISAWSRNWATPKWAVFIVCWTHHTNPCQGSNDTGTRSRHLALEKKHCEINKKHLFRLVAFWSSLAQPPFAEVHWKQQICPVVINSK